LKNLLLSASKGASGSQNKEKNSLAANLGKKSNTRRTRKNLTGEEEETRKNPNRRRRRNKKKPKQGKKKQQNKKKQTRSAQILLQNSKEGTADDSEGRNEYLTNFLFWPSMEWMVTGRFLS
jgi:hypothetical protein